MKNTPNSRNEEGRVADKDLLAKKKLATTIIASIIIAKVSDEIVAAS